MAIDPRRSYFPTGATVSVPRSAPRPLLTFGGVPSPQVPRKSPLSFGGTSNATGPLTPFSSLLGWNLGETVAPSGDPRRGTFPTGASAAPVVVQTVRTDGSAGRLNDISNAAQDIFQRMGLGRNPDQVAVTPAGYFSGPQAAPPRFQLPSVAILGALALAGYLILKNR